MTDKRKLNSIFFQALELESLEERANFVAQQCGEDHQLRDEIESLLASHRQAESGFLNQPAPGVCRTSESNRLAIEAGLAPALFAG